TFTVESYKADHAFANPSNPHHDAKATREANAKALAFIADSLGITKTVVRK
ncbi:MAG: dienelactone hydrolase family protein, partial [Flavobacteriales bacterium]|nr:dienelactone hydrolase family protein [Flavobacteriales bacterium]